MILDVEIKTFVTITFKQELGRKIERFFVVIQKDAFVFDARSHIS